MDNKIKEEMSTLLSALILRQEKEQQALAGLTSETLSSLNISVDALPLKCQQNLNKLSEFQKNTETLHLDPVSTRHKHSNIINSELELEYNLLELKQENTKLRREVERNNKFIDGLRKELKDVKESLNAQNPNPDNIQDYLRDTKQKLATYEEIYEKTKAKYSKLSVPEQLQPASLKALSEQLEAKRAQELELQQRADNIMQARGVRHTLRQLTREPIKK